LRIRELRQDDYAGVAAVLGRNGLRAPAPEQWRYLADATLQRRPLAHVPLGWILEDDQHGIVGTFRNIPFLYEWNQRAVRVVVASAWAVDAAFRRHSLMLASSYFTQDDVDVLLNTTAVADTSGKAFLAFGAEKVPQPAYTTRLLWITGYRGFAANLLRERGVPGASWLQHPAGVAAWIGDTPRRRGRMRDRVRAAAAFDARFDRFWATQREEPDRLRMPRDAATLTWRFALERTPPLVAVLERGSNVAGYCVLVQRNQGMLRRAEVADLQALNDDPDVVREVMTGALRLAREAGIHLVAMTGVGDRKREALSALRPHRKISPGWPLYYKASDPSLTAPLQSPSAWDVSLYDGDALWAAMFPNAA